VLGPLRRRSALVFASVETILLLDAASFVVSAAMLSVIARPFNAPITKRATSIPPGQSSRVCAMSSPIQSCETSR